jgi:CubicO group peptidase (beta-lactamase class C family)
LADGYNGPDDTLETARSKEYIETPAGGVIATVRDLDRYASAYLLKRDHDADIRAMEEHPYQVNERYSYGLGWEMITLDSHSVIFHSGGTNGYASVLMLVPANGLSLVAASNYGNDDVEGYAKALLHAIFDAAPASDHSMR